MDPGEEFWTEEEIAEELRLYGKDEANEALEKLFQVCARGVFSRRPINVSVMEVFCEQVERLVAFASETCEIVHVVCFELRNSNCHTQLVILNPLLSLSLYIFVSRRFRFRYLKSESIQPHIF